MLQAFADNDLSRRGFIAKVLEACGAVIVACALPKMANAQAAGCIVVYSFAPTGATGCTTCVGTVASIPGQTSSVYCYSPSTTYELYSSQCTRAFDPNVSCPEPTSLTMFGMACDNGNCYCFPVYTY
jgi:hypothetical protein